MSLEEKLKTAFNEFGLLGAYKVAVEEINRLQTELDVVKIQLAAADEGLLRCSGEGSWRGIAAETRGWMDRALLAEEALLIERIKS
jgi:hypothetical protein